MDQNSRRQYSPNIPGYTDAVEEAEYYGVPRTLALNATLAGGGTLFAVPIPVGCNRVLIKSKVTVAATGHIIVYHNQQRERVPGSVHTSRIATLLNNSGDESIVVQLPPGSGFLTATVASLGAGVMNAEVIFWREK